MGEWWQCPLGCPLGSIATESLSPWVTQNAEASGPSFGSLAPQGLRGGGETSAGGLISRLHMGCFDELKEPRTPPPPSQGRDPIPIRRALGEKVTRC